MKSITGFVPRAVFLSLCIGLASAAAFAGEASYNPPPSYYYCTSNPAPKTRYYSLVFKVPGSGVAYNQIATAFDQFLTQKYAVKSNAVCFGRPDENAVRTDVGKEMAQLRAVQWTITQTNWTYSGASPLSPTAPMKPSTQAANSSPQKAINGVYVGTYTCAKGPTDMKLTLSAPEYGLLTATLTFYLPPGSRNKAYTYSLNGQFDPASGKFILNPLKWETPAPPNYLMSGLKGIFDPQGTKVSGIVDYTGCGRFEAMKGRDD